MRWLTIFLVAAAFAQQPATIRVTTRMVQVNVVVHDKNGQPVADLKRDDFVLLDGGKPQQIRSFSVETSAVQRVRPEPLPVNTFTNRLEQRQDIPNAVTAILFDQLNTRWEDQAYAKQHLIRFLREADPRQRITLYSLGTQLRVVHDFSTDTASLIAALTRHKTRANTEVEAAVPADVESTGNAELDAWLQEGEQRFADLQLHIRVLNTLKALEAVAHHLGRLQGRKNLIWLSGSFPFSMSMGEMAGAGKSIRPITYAAELERTARAMNDAGIAMYPVSASGLLSDPRFSADRGGAFGGRSANIRYDRAIVSQNDTLRIIAERTGGRAFFNRNDISAAMHQAFEDAQVTYVLGYYPNHDAWNGEFREIKVQVQRRGLRVRHRIGYFAFADRNETVAQRNEALAEAVWSPLDAYGITLDVAVEPVRAGDPRNLRIKGHMDTGALTLEQGADGIRRGVLDILVVQESSEGRNVGGVNDTVSMALTPQSYERLLRNGASFSKDIELSPKVWQIRVVARDATSGAVGSVTIPVSQILR